MPDRLEQAALSGALFRERSHSPARSASTASVTVDTDDELGSDLSRPSSPIASRAAPMGHDGPQTGVKGVIADKQYAGRAEATARRLEQTEIRDNQERRKIIGQTAEEEDRARATERAAREAREDEEARDRRRRARLQELQRPRQSDDIMRRNGLKEVGQEGFVHAVERQGWVVVLIYEPYIARCQEFLAMMLDLSLRLPPVQSMQSPLVLLRARARNLSFSLLPSASSSPDATSEPDPDVLPTLLAYHDGNLKETWIRVDWESKEGGLEGLLRSAKILTAADQLGAHEDDVNEE